MELEHRRRVGHTLDEARTKLLRVERRESRVVDLESKQRVLLAVLVCSGQRRGGELGVHLQEHILHLLRQQLRQPFLALKLALVGVAGEHHLT